MPLSDDFTRQLRDAYKKLGEVQRTLAALEDEAKFDETPGGVIRILATKKASVGYMRQDLQGIPGRVREAEARASEARQ